MANAILGAVLSFLIPGLGQAYAGDIKKVLENLKICNRTEYL